MAGRTGLSCSYANFIGAPHRPVQLQADPAAVLGQYGIHQVGTRTVADLAGRIDIIDGPVEGHPKPWMDGDRLAIPLPQAPADYDIVATTDGSDVAAAGTQEQYIQNGNQDFSSTTTQKKNSLPSVPSISASLSEEAATPAAMATMARGKPPARVAPTQEPKPEPAPVRWPAKPRRRPAARTPGPTRPQPHG